MKLPVLNSVYQPTSSQKIHGLSLSLMGSTIFCPAFQYAFVRLLQATGGAKMRKRFGLYQIFLLKCRGKACSRNFFTPCICKKKTG